MDFFLFSLKPSWFFYTYTFFSAGLLFIWQYLLVMSPPLRRVISSWSYSWAAAANVLQRRGCTSKFQHRSRLSQPLYYTRWAVRAVLSGRQTVVCLDGAGLDGESNSLLLRKSSGIEIMTEQTEIHERSGESSCSVCFKKQFLLLKW